MKEKEFLEKIETLNPVSDNPVMEIPVFWNLDENYDVVLDFDSMRDELEEKIKKIKEMFL